MRSLRVPAGFGRWLLRIAHNRAVSVLRKRSRIPRPATLDNAVPARPTNALDERSEALLEAIGQLPEVERTVIVLRYFDGLSVQEISTACERPLGTVTKQLSRAYERLRSLLSNEERTQNVRPALGIARRKEDR